MEGLARLGLPLVGSGLPPGGMERLQEKHYKFGHCLDDLCRIFSFHIWPWRFTGFKQKGASVQHLALRVQTAAVRKQTRFRQTRNAALMKEKLIASPLRKLKQQVLMLLKQQ